MPVPLWTNKAEARYNVTTECNLGLHSAAATGNVGLVEYALARGQPINSVLVADGVLPLHAAAAGGNERVVKLLIERGADVNAPRLPRRYSNDKNRDTSAPIVGTSGSTPLHFAAANGNTSIVTTLLLRGAHANRADKHGITPEMLARQNGWDECAEVLKSWILNKDRDLRERQGPAEADEPPVGVPLNRFASRERDGSVGEGETSTRRRIHMKRSMDTALSMIKGKGSLDVLKPPLPSSSTSTLPANTSTLTPPPSPMKPFGEYTFYSNSPSPSPIDPGSRRPSLPQITYPVTPSVNRKTSLATRGNPRRPRSAGNGAEGEAEPTPFGRGGAGRKLGSKYSLLNMFKKGTEGSASSVPLERTGTQQSTTASAIPPGSALSSSSSVALPQPESSPGPVNLPETAAPFMRRPQNIPLPSSRLGIVVNTERPVLLADTRPRGQSLSSSSVSSLSPVLSAVDAESTIHAHADFPFSINEPPPVPPDGTSPREPSLLDNRGRGDSVSSTSTTDSQVNPQMSASGTTSGSGSVTVTTPLQVIETLAVSPQTSPLPIQTQLDGEQGEAERGAKLQANRLNERRSHTPLDINLSLISSHAQAEALVQKELQDILEMPVVSADSKGAGWTPLSARLAAYGESLQLERKFRPETTPVDQDDTPTSSRPQPPSSRTTASSQNKLRTQAHRNGVDRQNSLDVKPTSARRRIKEPKRPHTSSGTDSPSTECMCFFLLYPSYQLILLEAAPTHHSSRSTSAVSSQTDLRTVPIVAQTAATAAEVVNANYRVRRARTPDPELGLSRVSSLDGIESVDTELGPALTRVSTAPIPPTREKRVLERHIASANKLTRMGFSPAPQTKQDSAQTKRFGGLKSLMQTLKGKPV
ncbi:hypothetical protein C8R43DRAFT_896683 [Mycena crocata]|nr:hypothetical protein C8R43DRAFT_896683 [Mycena crocata]